MKKLLISLFVLSFSTAAATLQLETERHEGRETIKGHATCFALMGRLLLTARHNITYPDKKNKTQHYDEVRVKFNDKWHQAEIVKESAELDIAMIIIEPIVLAEDLKIEKRVLHMQGFEKGEKYVEFNLIAAGTDAPCKTITGVSGGPVFNDKEELVGMMVAGTPVNGGPELSTVRWISADEIMNFVNKNMTTIKLEKHK